MEFAQPTFDWIVRLFSVHMWSFLNSSFGAASLASAAGAYFGATAAQKVILKSKRKEALETELRNVNSAIMAAFTTANMALTVKKQLIKPIYDQFKTDLERFEGFEEKRKANRLSTGETFHFIADLQDFDTPPFPIQILNHTLFNAVDTESRALSAAAFLEASYSGLKNMMNKRRLLIDQFRVSQLSGEKFAYCYFGLEMPSGDRQKEYSDAIDGIMSYINDVIFFSKTIAEDLEVYGKKLREQEKLIPSTYSIRHADFSSPEEQGLMPETENYLSWLSGFIKSPNI